MAKLVPCNMDYFMSLKIKSRFKFFITSFTVIWPFSTVCLDMRPPWPSFAQIVISIVQVTPRCVHHEIHLDLDLMYKVEWMDGRSVPGRDSYKNSRQS